MLATVPRELLATTALELNFQTVRLTLQLLLADFKKW